MVDNEYGQANLQNEKNPCLHSIPLNQVNAITGIDYLVQPLFIRAGLVGIVGGSDVGKSNFMRQLLICIGNGIENFAGFPIIAKFKSALYVASEDDPETILLLMKKQAFKIGTHDEFLKNIHVMSDTDDLLGKLKADLPRKNFDIIIIDTFADIFSRKDGDSYKTTDIRQFLSPYQALALKHKCCIVFLHHTGKGKQNGEPSKDNILGGQGFEAKMRVVMELRADTKDSDKRQLFITKANYLSREEKSNSYVLSFTDLVFESNGERGSFEDSKSGLKEKNIEKDGMIAEMLRQGKQYAEIQEKLKVYPTRISAVKKKLQMHLTTTTILPSQNGSSINLFSQ